MAADTDSLLNSLLGKTGNTVTQTTSPEAIAALAKAYNINIDQATNPAAAADIVKAAVQRAQAGVTTGAAATRGSGAYSSAALSAAREKAMAEAASAANIEIAKTQQQSAAQATQAAQALAGATRVTTTGSAADDPTAKMLALMRSVGADTLANSPATGGTKTAGTSSGSPTAQNLATTLGTKALNYGGKIAQAGATTAVLKALAGSMNPLAGAFLGLAASDVIKTGTGALTDTLADVFGLKKKPEEASAALAAAPDQGMVDFVNAANSAGFDMSPAGTTVDAGGFNESTQALADLMGLTDTSAAVLTGDTGGDSTKDFGGSYQEYSFDSAAGMGGGHFGSDPGYDKAAEDAAKQQESSGGGSWW